MRNVPANGSKLKNPLLRERFPKIRDLGANVKKRFLVDYRPFGRKYFSKISEARAFADAKAKEAEQLGSESLNFPTALRVQTISALRQLRPWNATLSDAVGFYVAHLESQRRANDSPLIDQAVKIYIESRAHDFSHGRLKRRSLKEIASRVRQLEAAFRGLRVRDLTTARLQSFIDSLPQKPRSKRNLKVHVGTFCNFCIEQGWLEVNPITKIKLRLPELEIKILSLDEVTELLMKASASKQPDLLAFAAISLFSGIRVNELHQLKWEQVDLTTKAIEVNATASKVAKRRFVEINDTLLAFIAPIHQKTGKITESNFRSRWRRMLDGMKLSQNVLRHSAASFMIPIYGRVHVSEQLGNSPDVLAQHYRVPLPLALVRQFWALRPHS